MFAPNAAFSALAGQPGVGGIWLALKRPLFLASVIGCTVSLLTSEGLKPRLAAGATLCWSFIPLAEIVAMMAVCPRLPDHLPRARWIDLFFTGHGPWHLWLIGLGAIWSFFPPVRAYTLTRPAWLMGALSVVIPWSLWIDFCFFRIVLGRSRTAACTGVLLQRLISWSLVLAIIGAPAILPDVLGFLNR